MVPPSTHVSKDLAGFSSSLPGHSSYQASCTRRAGDTTGEGAPVRERTLETKPTVLVLLGSTREGRVGETVARWLMRQLVTRQEAAFELADLRDYPLPVYEGPSPDQREATARRWADKVTAADAYFVVTPEYNHGYPAALKGALDHAYEEWNRKPVAFQLRRSRGRLPSGRAVASRVGRTPDGPDPRAGRHLGQQRGARRRT